MKKLLSIILFIIFNNLNAQSNYFTIGSSEKKVIEVQGQPTSLTRTGIYSTFFYGLSSVSFSNHVVVEYYNSGNLKIRVGANLNKSKKKSKPKNKKKIVNNQVKWLYFTYMTTSYSGPDYDRITGDFKPHEYEYSKLYSISGYTYEMEQNLEFCLKKNYKESTGENVILISHTYDSRELALDEWSNEKGRLNRQSMCYYLEQYGVTEH